MEAALWSAIAVLAALSMGTLFVAMSRIDGLGSRLDVRIDGLASRIDGLSSRIDTLSATMTSGFDRVDDRLTGVEREIQAHVDRHAG